MSSADLVNWADHGSIAVARPTKGAKNSWASTATTKRLKINGQEKFFFFLANSGNGIGILSTDSPTGPFKNPFHRSLINCQTLNCIGFSIQLFLLMMMVLI